jgi:REP element-mobilizing transposase RayT
MSHLSKGRHVPRLYYSCVLIPRFKTHSLDNDLARFLNEQIPIICFAKGWRLEYLQIEKDYLQWIALLQPTVAPVTHIRTVRKESSTLILGNFVRMREGGLITDFWAPGYLLEPGNMKIPKADIFEFIQMNRQEYYPEDNRNSFFNTNYNPMTG